MSRLKLDQIRIASPCHVDWNLMTGDDRTRFCKSCQLSVHNVEGLTQMEAENLLLQSAGGKTVCLRLRRRADGTILTKDCPVGLRIAHRLKMKWVAFRLSIFSLLAGMIWFGSGARAAQSGFFQGKIAVPDDSFMMGDISLPEVPEKPIKSPKPKIESEEPYVFEED